jgi:hypothetical protein
MKEVINERSKVDGWKEVGSSLQLQQQIAHVGGLFRNSREFW